MRVSLSRLMIVPLLMAVMLVAGCGGTRALYGHAHTPPQYAKAVLTHHNAIGAQVADLVNDPAVTAQSKAKLREGYRLTVCDSTERAGGTPTAGCNQGPSYQLDAAIRAYEAARDAKTEAEIAAAVERLVPLITDLVNAIAGVK